MHQDSSEQYKKIKFINRYRDESDFSLVRPQNTATHAEYLIGRHPSCDLVFEGDLVSKVHGRIILKDNQLFFSDLGSTNGSKVGDEIAETNRQYLLTKDSIVSIDQYIIWVEDDSDPQLDEIKPDGLSESTAPQWAGETLTVRCVGVIRETHDVKTFRFVGVPTRLFTYKPGQFAVLALEIDGKKIQRSYSISSTPTRPNLLEITVKRMPPPPDVPDAPPGLVSNWLNDNMAVGHEIQLSGPFGAFTCVEKPNQKFLFISAGSGITPMMSMCRYLLDHAFDVDIVFIHSARTPNDIIFRQELELMAAQYANFRLAVTVTRVETGVSWSGYRGRLSSALLEIIASDLHERTAYVCGPNGFMAAMKSILDQMDFPMDNYYEESFGGPVHRPSNPEDQSTISGSDVEHNVQSSMDMGKATPGSLSVPMVVFSTSEEEVTCDGEDSILEAAVKIGLELPSVCRTGNCGVCKQKLIEGDINYRQAPNFECEEGHILCCIAQPVGRVVIEA